MSAASASDPSKSASKKKKKSKKKTNGTAQNGPAETNGALSEHPIAEDDEEGDEDEAVEQASKVSRAEDVPAENMSASQHGATQEDDVKRVSDQTGPGAETSARLEAMQEERDNLRAEVSELRKSLESLQEKHSEEVSSIKEELEQSQQSKDHAETQYRNLLGKVNTIRSQLGERLRADGAELEQKREQIEELESRNEATKKENESMQATIAELNSKLDLHTNEVESLRSRSNLSTNNWAKERDDLLSREAYLREEYEVAKQAMQDWEILATEERSRRENVEERLQEVEDQLRNQSSAYERARQEVETQNTTVDGLQRALRDLQEERKKELRDLVEQSQSQLDALTSRLEAADALTSTLRAEIGQKESALKRAEPFEKEVKEKNLLIGKLRHEAVILNDHLTKALRFLKRGKPEDNVDRQLVTNHFLHFLQLDRADPKKFQVLQLIAALLAWDDAQRETAGLVRTGGTSSTSFLNADRAPGASSSTGSLRAPLSPFRRTPSTPAFASEYHSALDSPGVTSATTKESLAELWSEFLDREAEAGSSLGKDASGSSRRPSLALSTTTAGGRHSHKGRTPSLAGLFSPSSEGGGGGNKGGGGTVGTLAEKVDGLGIKEKDETS